MWDYIYSGRNPAACGGRRRRQAEDSVIITDGIPGRC